MFIVQQSNLCVEKVYKLILIINNNKIIIIRTLPDIVQTKSLAKFALYLSSDNTGHIFKPQFLVKHSKR